MARIKSTIWTDQPFVSQLVQVKTVTIDATAEDSNNPNGTHILRAGLVLGHDGTNYLQYDDTAVDGTEVAACILLQDCDLKDGDPTAANADQQGIVMWIGEAVQDHLIFHSATGEPGDAAADLDTPASGTAGYIQFKSA
jgi:hypothetical protein